MKRQLALVTIPLLTGVLALGPAGMGQSFAAGRHQLSGQSVASTRHAPQLSGTLLGLPASLTAPTTMTVQSKGTTYTVDITTSTTLVRRFNGASALDELAVNDQLTVFGQLDSSSNTITATRIKDLSIQAAYTRMAGQVTAVSAAGAAPSLTVTVLKDSSHSPFSPGPSYTLPIGPSTRVTAHGSTVSGSLNGIVAGEQVTALGVFDRTNRNFVSVARIRQRNVVHHYQGYLSGVPSSTTAPATLTLVTPSGQITVTVSISTTIVRRFDGVSALDELSPNDQLQVTGDANGVGSVNASKIEDISIQAAATRLVGLVTAASPTSITVTVQKDELGHSPFAVGQSIVLPISSETKIILPSTTAAGATPAATAIPSATPTTTGTSSAPSIAVNAVVTALGVYDRAGQTFSETYTIRVH